MTENDKGKMELGIILGVVLLLIIGILLAKNYKLTEPSPQPVLPEAAIPNNICYKPDACNWSWGSHGIVETPVCLKGFNGGYTIDHVSTSQNQSLPVFVCMCCSPVVNK